MRLTQLGVGRLDHVFCLQGLEHLFGSECLLDDRWLSAVGLSSELVVGRLDEGDVTRQIGVARLPQLVSLARGGDGLDRLAGGGVRVLALVFSWPECSFDGYRGPCAGLVDDGAFP